MDPGTLILCALFLYVYFSSFNLKSELNGGKKGFFFQTELRNEIIGQLTGLNHWPECADFGGNDTLDATEKFQLKELLNSGLYKSCEKCFRRKKRKKNMVI